MTIENLANTVISGDATEPIVAIPLKISQAALDLLSTSQETMAGPTAPDIALIRLSERVYTLGGRVVERLAELRQIQPVELEELSQLAVAPPENTGLVTLVLGQGSLDGFKTDFSHISGIRPVEIGLVDFGGFYRLGGQGVIDYVEGQGVPTISINRTDVDSAAVPTAIDHYR